jgi:hypothetical protein
MFSGLKGVSNTMATLRPLIPSLPASRPGKVRIPQTSITRAFCLRLGRSIHSISPRDSTGHVIGVQAVSRPFAHPAREYANTAKSKTTRKSAAKRTTKPKKKKPKKATKAKVAKKPKKMTKPKKIIRPQVMNLPKIRSLSGFNIFIKTKLEKSSVSPSSQLGPLSIEWRNMSSDEREVNPLFFQLIQALPKSSQRGNGSSPKRIQ